MAPLEVHELKPRGCPTPSFRTEQADFILSHLKPTFPERIFHVYFTASKSGILHIGVTNKLAPSVQKETLIWTGP